MEYAPLVTFISPDDGIHPIGASKADQAMTNIAPEWKEHESVWGPYYTEVHEWAVVTDDYGNSKVLSHTRPDGRRLRRNDWASRFFQAEIYGTCVIKTFSGKHPDLLNALRRL